MYQSVFALNILRKCYSKYIHIAIETCGNVSWDIYKKAIQYLDWIFYDIKVIDRKKHIEFTGASNETILKNAEDLAKEFKGRLIFGSVIVPGFNDNISDIKKLVEFIKSLDRTTKEVNIIPVHHLSKEKYKMLGLGYFSEKLKVPADRHLNEIQNLFINNGIKCYIKNNTPF